MGVEVLAVAHPDRTGRLLLPAAQAAAGRGRGGADLTPAEGAGRSGAVAAALPRRVVRRARGLCLRPERRLRAVPAHDQSPPQGAPRRGPARPDQARGVGLLPRASRGPLRPQHAARRCDRGTLPGRRTPAELVGTAFLVMAVIGSGIAAQRLSPGDPGLQLLENSLATGAVLVALILALQPVSASFNPVVTLVERALGRIDTLTAAALVAAQVIGGVVGVMVANLMFALD